MSNPPNLKSQARIDRKCAAAILQAIDSFPRLLDECEAEAAAAIVADLIKAQVNRPIPEPDPATALADIIRLSQKEEADKAAY